MRRLFIWGLTLLLLTACSELPRKLEPSGASTLGLPLSYNYKDTTASNYYMTSYTTAGDKKSERNSILFELMSLVDGEYGAFERALRSDRAYKDVVVKVLSLALTGVATLNTGSTAQSLAAADTALKGANEAVDVSAFRDKAPELLINTMRANRAKVADQIYQGMNKTPTAYPLQAGIRDVVEYFNQGSVTGALASLAASTARDAENAQQSATTAKQRIQ